MAIDDKNKQRKAGGQGGIKGSAGGGADGFGAKKKFKQGPRKPPTIGGLFNSFNGGSLDTGKKPLFTNKFKKTKGQEAISPPPPTTSDPVADRIGSITQQGLDEQGAAQEALAIQAPPTVQPIQAPEAVNAITSQNPRDRVGTLNPTSINTPGTGFRVRGLDEGTSALELRTPSGEYKGTVSDNVANKLGRGTGSFTTLDPGVSAEPGTLFGRSTAEATKPGTLFGRAVTQPATAAVSEEPRRRRRFFGSPRAPGSIAAKYMKDNSFALNSSDPFRRAAANRQMKFALKMDQTNSDLYKADVVGNTSRKNTLNKIDSTERENRLGLEADRAKQIRGISAKAAERAEAANAGPSLQERKFQYTQEKDRAEALTKSVNRTTPGLTGTELANPVDRFREAMRSNGTNAQGLKKKMGAPVIYSMFPELQNMDPSRISGFLSKAGASAEDIHNITNSLN